MSVRRYRVHGSPTEVISRVEQGFIPLISKEPHFHADYLLNPGGGVLVTVSLFTNQAGAEESNRLAADWITQNLAALVSLQEITVGDVTVHAGL